MIEFVAVDVETANAFMGSICQIGAVRFQDGVEVDSISWLVDPETYFDEINISIHGITSETVSGKPSFTALYSDLCNFISGSVTVSHTHFDRVSISQACSANSLPMVDCRWLDSARVARRTWADVAWGGYGLANLAAMLEIEFHHHDALEDARAAAQIMLRAQKESGLGIEDWLMRVRRPINLTKGDDFRREGDGDGPLVEERVTFTGTLAMPRRQAADLAHELGAAVEPNLTKKTTILVAGDQDLSRLAGHDKSSKQRKAEALMAAGHPIRIIAESDFMAFEE